MTLRLACAASAGLVLSFAYQPTGLWWVAAPALAVLVLCCWRQPPGRSLLYGLVFGLAWYVPMLDWLSAVIGADAGFGLAAYSALWIGAAAAGIALVTRLPGWWLWVPAVWILQEAVSGRIPFGGWGWGRIGFSQDSSPLLPVAALAGVPGLGFAVVLVGSLLAAVALAGWRWGRVRLHDPAAAPIVVLLRAGVGPIAALAGLVAVTVLVPVPTAPQALAGPAQRDVAIVQGDVPQSGLDFNAQRRAVLDNHVQQTLALAQDVAAGRQQRPDFVLWPENASDIDPYRNADARTAIDAAARTMEVPILVGTVVTDPQDPDFVLNQGIVWDPVSGPGAAYTKRNLVPFGEYVPFRSWLAPLISRFDRVPRDFAPGEEPGGLDIGGTRIGDAICFDVAYDDTVRQAVRDGGRMLVIQTNNATYNGTAQPFQQFAMSRIRAVEHGRAIAVVSTSGLSGVIAADGSVVSGTAAGGARRRPVRGGDPAAGHPHGRRPPRSRSGGGGGVPGGRRAGPRSAPPHRRGTRGRD